MNNKKVWISSLNGQDGSYLAEHLLDKEYKVYGTIKRKYVTENQTARLDNIY